MANYQYEESIPIVVVSLAVNVIDGEIVLSTQNGSVSLTALAAYETGISLVTASGRGAVTHE